MIHLGESLDLKALQSLAAIKVKAKNDEEIEKIKESLNAKQKEAFVLALSGCNLFITGVGGTGKSYLIKAIHRALTLKSRSVCLAASTGKAALNIGGLVINGILGIGCDLALKASRQDFVVQAHKLSKIDCIILDEISMVRVDVLDSLYKVIEKINKQRAAETDPKKKRRPLQCIVLGDFHQLPAVYGTSCGESDYEVLSEFYRRKYNWDIKEGYAFQSRFWNDFHFKRIRLTECVRIGDQRQQYLLELARKGCNIWDILKEIDMLCSPSPFPDAPWLFPLNEDSERKNLEKLQEIDKPMFAFPPIFEGEVSDAEQERVKTLYIKESAQVLLTCNACNNADWIINPNTHIDAKSLFVNGTTGVITRIVQGKKPEDDEIWVAVNNKGSVIEFGLKRRTEIVYKLQSGGVIKKPVGSVSSFCLLLGWAISVHKSQGMTLEHANISVKGGGFADGLGYVALSRCKSLEGVYLQGWLVPGDLKASEAVLEFERQSEGKAEDDPDWELVPRTDEYGTVGVDGYQGFGFWAYPHEDNDDFDKAAALAEYYAIYGDDEITEEAETCKEHHAIDPWPGFIELDDDEY